MWKSKITGVFFLEETSEKQETSTKMRNKKGVKGADLTCNSDSSFQSDVFGQNDQHPCKKKTQYINVIF